MHDLKTIREEADRLREAMRRRGALATFGPAIDEAEALDRDRRRMIQAVEEKKAQRNATTQVVGRKKKAGEDASAEMELARGLGEEIAAFEAQLGPAEARLTEILLGIPNIPLSDVPEGDETHNVVVRSWGTPRAAEGVKPHWEVGAALGLLDLERGARSPGPVSSSIAVSARG